MPTTRTVVPASPEAGLTMREAAKAGTAVTSCKPSDKRKSTSEPASRLPIDHPCLRTPAPRDVVDSILRHLGMSPTLTNEPAARLERNRSRVPMTPNLGRSGDRRPTWAPHPLRAAEIADG